jgi:octaprenyl-diphosphate synthase
MPSTFSQPASIFGRLDLAFDLCHFASIHPSTLESFLYQQNKRKIQSPSVLAGIVEKIPFFKESLDPFSCVAEELELVEQNLTRSIRSKECTLTEISSHLIHSGGKRVRPMVTLLAFKAFGGKRTADVVDIATAIELIHTATLLHDDIIDGANIRRGRESANKRFGLKSTLVTGDFLFIKAFEFAGKFDDTVVQWTADACTLLTEGEILQGYFNRNTKVAVKDYLEIVRRKTASLFQTGTKLGAYMAGATPPQVEWIGQYGLNLGIAFQMIDDVLDIVGHKELLGKPTGMDLRDGNPSLPIVLSLRVGQKAVVDTFECPHPSEGKIRGAIEAMVRGIAIQQAKVYSKKYALKASKLIEKIPPSLYRSRLRALVQLIIERDF